MQLRPRKKRQTQSSKGARITKTAANPKYSRRSSLLSEEQIRRAHLEISNVWPTHGKFPPIGPAESAILANQYYELHAPPADQGVKVLLLAESHASTCASIVGASCIDGVPKHIGHLNLVHCLTYGEKHVLDLDNHVAANPPTESVIRSLDIGTLAFWRLLASCAGTMDMPPTATPDQDPLNVSKAHAAFHTIEKGPAKRRKTAGDSPREAALTRVANKADILQRLAERGVMLVDLCPVPIYVGGGGNTVKRVNKKTGNTYTCRNKSLSAKERTRILRTSWDHYASKVIEQYKPQYVIVLGKAVMKGIGGESILEKCLEKHNGKSLGCLYHPSSHEMYAWENQRVQLQFVRDVAQYVSEYPNDDSVQKRFVAGSICELIVKLVAKKKLLNEGRKQTAGFVG